MEELVPSEFHLSQNFPNPFKDCTKIKYCLPVKMRVRLLVFDIDGRVVKELIDEIEKAGTYEFKFYRRDLPDGIYDYRLLAFDPETLPEKDLTESNYVFTQTKKMTLK
jgi:hypothetical protein